MRKEIADLVERMEVVAIDNPNGGQTWEIQYNDRLVWVREEFFPARRGYQGDTERVTWYDHSSVPKGVPGELQFGKIDAGYCRPIYHAIGGLTADEYEAVGQRRDQLIAAAENMKKFIRANAI